MAGITKEQVLSAINTIVAEGQKPTIERIRKQIGGSPNTILLYLKEWRDSKPMVERQVAALSADLLQVIDRLKEVIGADSEKAGLKAKADIEDDLSEERLEVENLSTLCGEWEEKNKGLEDNNLELTEENKRLSILSEKQQTDLDQLKLDHKTEIEALEKALQEQRESAEGSRMEAAKIAVRLESMADFEKQAIDLQEQVKELLSSKAGIEKDLAVTSSERDSCRANNERLTEDVAILRQHSEGLKEEIVGLDGEVKKTTESLGEAIHKKDLAVFEKENLVDGLSIVKKEMVELREEHKDLKGELNEITASKIEAEKSLAVITSERDSVLKQLVELKAVKSRPE